MLNIDYVTEDPYREDVYHLYPKEHSSLVVISKQDYEDLYQTYLDASDRFANRNRNERKIDEIIKKNQDAFAVMDAQIQTIRDLQNQTIGITEHYVKLKESLLVAKKKAAEIKEAQDEKNTSK